MILVPGHNPMGNVLHLILGPESDLFSDLNGMQIVDISALLEMFNRDEPVFIQVTRTNSEQHTIAGLMNMGLPVASTFVGGGQQQQVSPKVKAVPHQPSTRQGVCSYCNQPAELVPTKAFRICEQCLQIELGLNKQRKTKPA